MEAEERKGVGKESGWETGSILSTGTGLRVQESNGDRSGNGDWSGNAIGNGNSDEDKAGGKI